MKKGIIIFLRVTFVLCVMCAAVFFGARAYFMHESRQAIQLALTLTDAPVMGDKNRPFTIVEFFDYRCPHCPEMAGLVNEAVDGDAQTKVLLRPAVLMDNDSYRIAALVLSADKQKEGMTIALHKQIMALPQIPTYDIVKAMAQSQGIDIEQGEKDALSPAVQDILSKNTKLVKDIGFYGVPALIIGDKGFVPRAVLPSVNELKLMMIDAKTRLNLIKE